jgi:predicted Zn finger-like uncharacterized protein
MILICPSCGTRFFLDDSRIAPGGRRVQCDACGEVWKALGVASVEPPAMSVAGFDIPTPPAPEPFADTSEEPGPMFTPRLSFGEPRRPPRAEPTPAIGRLGWIMAALLILVIVGIVVLNEREWIVRAWPPSAAFYKAGGLPVSSGPPPHG